MSEDENNYLLDGITLAQSANYLGDYSQYFKQDLQLSSEYLNRVVGGDAVSDEYQKVYNEVDREIQSNIYLENLKTNIWERYEQLNLINGIEAKYMLPPDYPATVLTREDVENGYHLEYIHGEPYRITDNGYVHPDDLVKLEAWDKLIENYHEEASKFNHNMTTEIDYSNVLGPNGFTPQSGAKVILCSTGSGQNVEGQNGIQEVIVTAKRIQPTYLVKASEYTPSIYNGKIYNIYVPWNGTDINSGGWQTVGVYNTTFVDFRFSQFASGIAPANLLNVKPIIESGDSIIYKHYPSNNGMQKLSAVALGLAALESGAKAWQSVPIQVLTQEKDGQSRIIIQVGLNSKYFYDNAGKTLLPQTTGNEGAWNVLTDNRTFRLTLDAQHAQDPFTAFISINKYGQFVLTPKVYSGDKLEIGHSGFWSASDFKEIPMSPTIISKDGPYKSLAEKLEGIFSK